MTAFLKLASFHTFLSFLEGELSWRNSFFFLTEMSTSSLGSLPSNAMSNSGNAVAFSKGSFCKKAFQGELQDGSRLEKQMGKQKCCQQHIKLLDGVKVPNIEDFSYDEAGNAKIQMEYLPFQNLVDFNLQASTIELGWVWERIKSFLDAESDVSPTGLCKRVEKWETILGDFLLKKDNVLKVLKEGRGNLDAISITEAESIVMSVLDCNIQDKLLHIEIPIGFCHGDFNFGNIMSDTQNKSIYLYDFLDSFVESPLQDMAAFKQDVEIGWFI